MWSVALGCRGSVPHVVFPAVCAGKRSCLDVSRAIGCVGTRCTIKETIDSHLPLFLCVANNHIQDFHWRLRKSHVQFFLSFRNPGDTSLFFFHVYLENMTAFGIQDYLVLACILQEQKTGFLLEWNGK